MRHTQAEKYELILLVERSEIGVNRTLKELGLRKSTFYKWYNKYLENGYDGLADNPGSRNKFWNQIPDEEKKLIVDLALENPQMYSRELSFLFTDKYKRFVSESSVHRILRDHGMIHAPAFNLLKASDEFKDKTVRVNEMWQTDFTYFKIPGWGWYYLSTVIDDFSRYIVHWELFPNMRWEEAKKTIEDALVKSDLYKESAVKPKILSDNGPSYIAGDFNDFIHQQGMELRHGRPLHPQTQGKIERYHRSMKNVVKQEIYYSPDELRFALTKFVDYYNNERYHESLNNVTPAQKYFGQSERVLAKRRKIKSQTLKERRKSYMIQKLCS